MKAQIAFDDSRSLIHVEEQVNTGVRTAKEKILRNIVEIQKGQHGNGNLRQGLKSLIKRYENLISKL
jgi:hypothetical protein